MAGIVVYNNTSASINVGSSYSISAQSSKTCYYTTGSSVKISGSRYITSSGGFSYYVTWPSSGTLSVYEYSRLTYDDDGNGYISCDYDDGDYVRQGRSVSMTAVPYSGYTFNYWSGDKSGTSNPLNFTMGFDDLDIYAHFKGSTVGITVYNETKDSTISVGSSYSISAQSSATCYYNPGTSITITSSSAPINSSGGTSYSVTWPSSGTIEVKQYSRILVSTSGAVSGSTFTLSTGNGAWKPYGTSFTITSSPSSEQETSYIRVYSTYHYNTDSYSGTYDWTNDLNAIVAFKSKSVAITVINATNVTLHVGSSYDIPRQSTLSCSYSPGTSITITSDEKVPLQSTGATSITISWPSSGTLTIGQYAKLTFAGNYGGSVTGDHTSGSYLIYGTSVKLTAQGDSGYDFYNWNDGSTDNPYTFTMGWEDVNKIANFKRYHTIKIQLRDAEGVISEHATGTYIDKTTSTSIPAGIDTKVYDGDEISLLASSFDAHYHLVEWKSYDTGVIYSTSNPYTFNITSDMNITGVVDLYTQHTIDARRIINETESVIFGDYYISVGIPDSEGYITIQKITTGGQYAYFYADDENIEITFHVGSVSNYGQQFKYVTDTGTGTTYNIYTFTFTPGNRDVMLHFVWIYTKLHVYGNFTPRANGYLRLTYYDSYPNGNVITVSESSEDENASIWWDKETYPNGVINCNYVITDKEESQFSYWEITNELSGYVYKYDDIHHYSNCLLDTSEDYGIEGYSQYHVQLNAVKSYTYVVSTIGGGDASAYVLDPEEKKHTSFTFYEGETVNIGVTYDDTKYHFIHWVIDNMKDPSDIDVTSPTLSFIANSNHGREVDYDTYIRLTAYFEGGGTQCTVSVSVLPEDGGDVMIDREFVKSKVVSKGTEVELTAVPTTETTFSSWSDGSTDNPHKVIITKDTSLIAYFSTGTDYNAICMLITMIKKSHRTMIMRRER